MKLSMTLTLDGMIRALRTRAHDMADAIETGGSGSERPGQAGSIEDRPAEPGSPEEDRDGRRG